MKASEILRKLADVIDQHSSDERPTNSTPHAALEPVDVDHEDHSEPSVFITPLQAKLELLKKSVGVGNVYDQDDCEQPDELAIIKQHAGIPVAAVHEMSDDEPLDQ